jgi:hypothetical protein
MLFGLLDTDRLFDNLSTATGRVRDTLQQAPDRAGRLMRVPVRSRRLLTVEMVVSMLSTSVLMSLMVPQGVLARRLGASSNHLTLLSMSIFLGFLFTRAGRRLTRYVHNGVLIFALRLLAGAALGMVYFVTGPLQFVLVMILFRMLDGATVPSQKTVQKDFYPAPARGMLMAWVRIVAVVGAMGLSWWIGVQLDESQDSFRWVFPVMGALLAGGSAAFLFIPDRATRRSHNRQQADIGEWDVFKEDRRFRRFLLIFFIATFAEKMLMPLQPILMADRFNTSYKELATVFGIAGPLAGIVGYWVWARVITERRVFTVLAIVFFVKALRPLLFALAPAGGAGLMHSDVSMAGLAPVLSGSDYLPYLVTGEMAFRTMISGLELSSLLAIMAMADDRRMPVYVSLHFLFIAIRGIAGPLIGNGLYQAYEIFWPGRPDHIGIRSIYVLAAVIVIVGALGMVWLARKEGAGARETGSAGEGAGAPGTGSAGE